MAPPPAATTRSSNECTLHFTSRRTNNKQPLYRPAALRRNESAHRRHDSTPTPQHVVSPPMSPALAVVESKASSWITNLPWSPIGEARETPFEGAGPVTGQMLPRALWRRDEEALVCADTSCQTRFGLVDRRHHCRRCGEIYCGAHSSRTTPLWSMGSADVVSTPPTPKATPRSTPRGSYVNIAAMNNPASPTSSSISLATESGGSSSTFSNASQSLTPTGVSPLNTLNTKIPTTTSATLSSPLPSTPAPVLARVCDACYFAGPNAPMPLLTPPLSAFSSPSTPFTLRHPNFHSTTTSPSQSPPNPNSFHHSRRSKSSSRSRQGSASSSIYTAASTSTTPPTSLESSLSGVSLRGAGRRGISPATSMRACRTTGHGGARLDGGDDDGVYEEGEEEEEEEDDAAADERHRIAHEGRVQELLRTTTVGSVQGEFSWPSWATF